MKKGKIVLTVIKESDGSFGLLGQPEKNLHELIATQADSWEALKAKAVESVNAFLKEKDRPPISIKEIDFSFDLPSFLDANPQLTAAALSHQPERNKTLLNQKASSKKKAPNRQTDRILAALKQLGRKPSKSRAKK